ncbi:MAG: hypothetical protein A2017_04580 [Lentisphaerae bacterium GWF2_44_16]|nr:MAG: hypothetical protein A2017_04580 [Lentisphaerae bacterium GWF2_44_16]
MPLNAEKFLPHRKPMLFIDSLAEFSEKYARAEIKINENNIFLNREGILDPLAGVEFIAQTAALFSARSMFEKSGTPFSGLLVGLRDFEFFHALKSGNSVSVEVEKTDEIGAFALFQGKISSNGKVALSGTIKVWHGTNEAPPPAVKERSVIEKSTLEKQISESIKSVEKTNNTIQGTLSFDAGFKGFEGHFPGMPVLPGVILMKSVIMFLNGKYALKKISNAKFSKSVLPGDILKVSASLENEILKAKVFSVNTPVASFSMELSSEK